jgi:hypothetical protein
VDGKTTELSVDHLALTGMHPGPHFDAQGPRCVSDRASATHGSGGTVERGEQSVAGGVDLLAAKAVELAANERMVRLEQVAPSSVTELDGAVRRGDDVHEQCCC